MGNSLGSYWWGTLDGSVTLLGIKVQVVELQPRWELEGPHDSYGSSWHVAENDFLWCLGSEMWYQNWFGRHVSVHWHLFSFIQFPWHSEFTTEFFGMISDLLCLGREGRREREALQKEALLPAHHPLFQSCKGWTLSHSLWDNMRWFITSITILFLLNLVRREGPCSLPQNQII